MKTPGIAVVPVGSREYIAEAAKEAGARVVEPDEAEVLVWMDSDRPEDLTALLREHPGIRWVQLPWAGVEPYAEAGVFDHDHIWTCGKGVYARPVAEHALTLALAGLRGVSRFVRARQWEAEAGISLMGGRVTIFGGGGITRVLVDLLQPFGCSIKVIRRREEDMEGVNEVLPFSRRYEALKGADVVFLALALTPETTGLISQVELELMEPHAWLVNVARGQHVVTEDLVVALRGDVIGGAGLDVTDPEPLPEGHPLWSLPNCIITPHVANTEDMAQPLLSERIRNNVRRYVAGEELLGRVDPDLGY